MIPQRQVAWRSLHVVVAVLVLTLGLANRANADITRIVITSIESPTFEGVSFGEVGQYEKVRMRAFGEVDPNDPRNAGIADIQLAPRDARGMVQYSMDVFVLKPVVLANGNHRLLYYMNNRGNLDSALFPSIGVLSVSMTGDEQTVRVRIERLLHEDATVGDCLNRVRCHAASLLVQRLGGDRG